MLNSLFYCTNLHCKNCYIEMQFVGKKTWMSCVILGGFANGGACGIRALFRAQELIKSIERHRYGKRKRIVDIYKWALIELIDSNDSNNTSLPQYTMNFNLFEKCRSTISLSHFILLLLLFFHMSSFLLDIFSCFFTSCNPFHLEISTQRKQADIYINVNTKEIPMSNSKTIHFLSISDKLS